MTSNYGNDIGKTVASIKTTTNEILMIQKKMAPSISYGVGNTVILKDAFGKPIPLIMDLCYSPEVCCIDVYFTCADIMHRFFMTF